MHRTSRSRPALLLVGATLALAACGDRTPDAQSQIPSDSLIRPMEREPLTEADMGGIPMSELALELPWTQNKVSRDAAAGAPPVALRSAEVASFEGFDRVTFTTDDPLPATGYEITFAESGTSVSCGGDAHELATRSLVVRFSPARAGEGDERWIADDAPVTGASRMARAGLVCDEDGTVIWAAELAAGDRVRVLELREPGRVAVDVR